MEKNSPEKRVGLVTFNHSVQIFGDGKTKASSISECDLDTKELIESRANETPNFDSIKSCKSILSQKLIDLEENGGTALGPALLASVLMASKKTGSQVILCTDGLANKGLGALDIEDIETSKQFYNDITNTALVSGVSVSLITIEGTNCRLGVLGDIADKTMGIVNIVNPLELMDEFSSILKEEIISTNVSIKLVLPKVLYVKSDECWNTRESRLVKQVGNVTRETEITFEFGLREDSILENDLKKLPFQLQISYIAKDGSRLLRVLTLIKNVTQVKEIAENHSDRSILTSYLAQSSSKMIQQKSVSSRSEKMASYIRKM